MRRLLIRPGAIGDCIVSLPALEHLRAPYTEVWTSEAVAPLIRFADRVRTIGSTSLDLLELDRAPAQLLDTLRSFDDIVSWYGAARPEFHQAVAGLPFRFFEALPRGGSRHAVDFYLDQVGGEAGAVPRILVEPAAPHGIVIHPFSGSASKNWPLDRFRELAARLGPVEWCAGPSEPLDGAVRKENLYELACWLASARLYIGNDSGITHLAAAAGAPVVAIFGPTDPTVWAPRGRCVRVVRNPSPDDVLRACALQ